MRKTFMLLLTLAACAATHAATRPFAVRDLVMLDRVSDPRVSPDGKLVAFQLRETDLEANKGVNGIWVRSLEHDAAPRRLTAKGVSSSTPRWSADSRGVYYTSASSGSTQVWRADVAGGAPRQVTNLPLDVGSFLVSPDGRRLAFSAAMFADCADLACTKKRLDERAKGKASGQAFDGLFIRHWDTWYDGTRSQLFAVALDAKGVASGEPKLVSRGIDGDVPSKPFGDESEYAFAPDGESLVFAARIAGRTEAWSTNFDLFRADIDGDAAPANLTDANDAWDTGPAFSRDGRTLYYRAMKRPTFEADRLALMAMDLANGKSREIAAEWDRSADGTVLSRDGRTLYSTAQDMGEHALFAIDIASGKARRLAGGGTINAFSVGDDEIVFARDDLKSTAQLYRIGLRGGEPRALTDFNRERMAALALGDYEQFEFAGWNGETVRAYVVKPANFDPARKYPLAFLIHGGPQGSFGNQFHYRWNPQTYAGQGFVSVMVDFHGSTGYGQAFTDSITGDWGGKPLEDLQKGLAAAFERYAFIDRERVCALGGSYGGYMVNWIAGRWSEPFDCLVSHSGVFDNRMMGYSTEELWFDEWEFQGTPFDEPANYERHNPVVHVAQWRKPILVIHGQLDYRIPVEQGIAAFTAAQRRGIESRFLYFPDENHWILKPANSILWHDTVNGWLKAHFASTSPSPTQ